MEAVGDSEIVAAAVAAAAVDGQVGRWEPGGGGWFRRSNTCTNIRGDFRRRHRRRLYRNRMSAGTKRTAPRLVPLSEWSAGGQPSACLGACDTLSDRCGVLRRRRRRLRGLGYRLGLARQDRPVVGSGPSHLRGKSASAALHRAVAASRRRSATDLLILFAVSTDAVRRSVGNER